MGYPSIHISEAMIDGVSDIHNAQDVTNGLNMESLMAPVHWKHQTSNGKTS